MVLDKSTIEMGMIKKYFDFIESPVLGVIINIIYINIKKVKAK
jgi:hypothetical protein